jgi:hypothetical protein
MKDAKGHGSNAGWKVSLTGKGTEDGVKWSRVSREFNVPASRARTQADAEREAINAHESMGWYKNMRVTGSEPIFDPAHELASGPKSAPAPVHDSMSGRLQTPGEQYAMKSSGGPKWKYQDARGVDQTGHMERYVEHGGTDHTAYMRSDSGDLHLVSGSRLKAMSRIWK